MFQISKVLNFQHFKCNNHPEIWHAAQQHYCWAACHITVLWTFKYQNITALRFHHLSSVLLKCQPCAAYCTGYPRLFQKSSHCETVHGYPSTQLTWDVPLTHSHVRRWLMPELFITHTHPSQVWQPSTRLSPDKHYILVIKGLQESMRRCSASNLHTDIDILVSLWQALKHHSWLRLSIFN